MHDINKIQWPGWETVCLLGRDNFGSVYKIKRTNSDGVDELAALRVVSIPQSDYEIEGMIADGLTENDIKDIIAYEVSSLTKKCQIMKKIYGHLNVLGYEDYSIIRCDDGIGYDIFIKMDLLTPLNKTFSKDINDERVIKIRTDICKALELCEKEGLNYRTITPNNIFVSESGEFVLDDSGYVDLLPSEVGRCEFYAPEIYKNKSYNPERVKVYSLGLVLYWLLNNRRHPFVPQPPEIPSFLTKDDALKRIYSGETIPEPVNGSRGLKNIILKACSYNQDDRFKSVTEMKDALERFHEYGSDDEKDDDKNSIKQCKYGHLYYAYKKSCPICKIVGTTVSGSYKEKRNIFSKIFGNKSVAQEEPEKSENDFNAYSDNKKENHYENLIKRVCPFCGIDYLWGKDDSESYRKRRPILDYCDECNTKLVEFTDSNIDIVLVEYSCSDECTVSVCLPRYGIFGIGGILRGLQYRLQNDSLYYKLMNTTLILSSSKQLPEDGYKLLSLKEIDNLKFDVVVIYNQVRCEKWNYMGYERVYYMRNELGGQILFNKCKCRNSKALKTILTTEIDKKYIVN